MTQVTQPLSLTTGGCCIRIHLWGRSQLAASGKMFLIFMQHLLWEDDNFGEECQLKLTPFPEEMCLHISLGKMPTGSLGRWILWGRHIFMQQSFQNQTSLREECQLSTLKSLFPTHFPKERIFPKIPADIFPEDGFLCNTLQVLKLKHEEVERFDLFPVEAAAFVTLKTHPSRGTPIM